MNIEILSRLEFERFVFEMRAKPCIAISIRSKGETEPFVIKNLHNKIKNIMFTEFNDTDNQSPYFGGMEAWQAVEIAKFIKDNYNSKDDIVVHCDKGRGSSAGVAAAILKYYKQDDSEVFKNNKYMPNMLCYRLVLSALQST